jgi:hypothetical protein
MEEGFSPRLLVGAGKTLAKGFSQLTLITGSDTL